MSSCVANPLSTKFSSAKDLANTISVFVGDLRIGRKCQDNFAGYLRILAALRPLCSIPKGRWISESVAGSFGSMIS